MIQSTVINNLQLRNLVVKESTKRKNSKACAQCASDININERYMSVTYNDGFVRKNIGAFHPHCWEEFKLKKK